MREFFRQLFSTDGFPPRWNCGDWSDLHGWIHVCSDVAIAGAYAAIPIALGYFVIKRKDVPFPPIFWLFGAFILACGTGHFIEATIFWHPWYRLSGAVKLMTALVSWATVAALIRTVPQALHLPGLAKLNADLMREIEEKKTAEAALRRIEAFESAVLGASLDAIITIDGTGKVVEWNAAAERIFGYSVASAVGQEMGALIVPARLREAHKAGIARYLAAGEPGVMGRLIELPAVRADGTEIITEVFTTPIESDGPALFTGFVRDITERKKIEAQREAALEQSEMLLREVHHRVKNNMQVISSLLRLQAGKLHDPEQKGVFAECQERIRAMALIHERLYGTGQFARIEFSDYLAEMTRMILGSSAEAGSRVRLDLRREPLDLDLDVAMPLSLIASELVINALKHGFAGGRTGLLTITLRRGAEMNELTVQDDGHGMPAGAAEPAPGSSTGIGMELVESLTRQIRGRREVRSDAGGTSVTIRWPAQPRASEPASFDTSL